LLGLQAGTALTRSDIRNYVQQTIDVYVQLNRRGGTRFVERIALRG